MGQTRGQRQQSNEIHFRNISTADPDELQVCSIKFDNLYLGIQSEMGSQKLIFKPKSYSLKCRCLVMHVQSPKWDENYVINCPAWFNCLDLFIIDVIHLIHSSPIYHSILWYKTYNVFKYNRDQYSFALLRPSPACSFSLLSLTLSAMFDC